MRFLLAALLWLITTALLVVTVPALWAQHTLVDRDGYTAFAASAYGKLTGRPAACLTIAGPGATNLLTGLWDAKVDRSPVLALTVLLAPTLVPVALATGAVRAWSRDRTRVAGVLAGLSVLGGLPAVVGLLALLVGPGPGGREAARRSPTWRRSTGSTP